MTTTCHTLDLATGRIRHLADERPAVADRLVYGDFDQVVGYRWDTAADVDPATAREVIGRHFDERLVTRAADWHHPQECQCRADYPDEPDPLAEQLTETWAAVADELGALNGPVMREFDQ